MSKDELSTQTRTWGNVLEDCVVGGIIGFGVGVGFCVCTLMPSMMSVKFCTVFGVIVGGISGKDKVAEFAGNVKFAELSRNASDMHRANAEIGRKEINYRLYGVRF